MDLTSTAQLLGNLGEFVGAIAVVATLIYLAIQVRHSKEATEANTRSMEVQSYQAWQIANLEINMAMSNPAQAQIVATGSLDPTKLTDESWLAFVMMHVAIMQMAQSTDYLYRAGSLDRELWESEMNRAAGILSFRGVRQFWDAGGKTNLTPRFVKFMESTQSNIAPINWDSERGFFRDETYKVDSSPH